MFLTFTAYLVASATAWVLVLALQRNESGDGTKAVWLLLVAAPWWLMWRDITSFTPLIVGNVVNLAVLAIACDRLRRRHS